MFINGGSTGISINALTKLLLAAGMVATLAGCGADQPAGKQDQAGSSSAGQSAQAAPLPAANPLRNLYFGELHVHTKHSFDAFIFGTRATPDDAYRYSKGEAIKHPAGFDMQLREPLDFTGVTDHAMYLGIVPAMFDEQSAVGSHHMSVASRAAKTAADRYKAFQNMFPYLNGDIDDGLLDKAIVRSAWQDIIQAAERHNDPGTFTTFIAYEFTSGPEQQNLHRNVIFRGSEAPDEPFSRLDSMNPEKLWDWMDDLRDQGIESLAIPHNSNGSNGQMFALEDWAGNPLDAAYAEQRIRNEPLVEASQVKGDSETHPALSPNDEWADFETMELRIASTLASKPQGSYIREALLNGIRMEDQGGFNPYRFGMISSSDTHVGAGGFDEDNYWSKAGMLDSDGKLRGSVPTGSDDQGKPVYADTYFNTWGAAGLAAVWAEENTRASLFDAMRRKETYATTGPRMALRFFAAGDFPDGLANDPNMVAKAYAAGVPMGGDLSGHHLQGQAPEFLLWATRDPDSAPLQRLQVVKGWVDQGASHEAVYDVACSDGLTVDPKTHRCPDNGAKVNLSDCSISRDRGAAELVAQWQDPVFDPRQRAFYYVRVLENPSCRWSTWDALRARVPPRQDLHPVLQERAYSSPIWFVPAEA